jgi:hypothetical protein
MMEDVNVNHDKKERTMRREIVTWCLWSRSLHKFKLDVVPSQCKDKSKDNGMVKVRTKGKGTKSEKNHPLYATSGD